MIKIKWIKCVAALFIYSSFSCAQAQNSQNESTSLLDNLETQTATLEKELAALKKEMNQLQAQQNARTQESSSSQKQVIHTDLSIVNAPNPGFPHPRLYKASDHPPPEETIINGNAPTLAGMPIIAMPFVGRRPGFDDDGTLLYNSYANQDIRYMWHRNVVEQSLEQNGTTIYSPIIALNGNLEPVFLYGSSFSGPTSGKMTIAALNFNAAAIMNPWVEGIAAFTHSSEPIVDNSMFADNDDAQMTQAYVNIGNLAETPFYMTAGQVYVPFGQQYTNMTTFPLSTILNTTRVMSAVIGMAPRYRNDFFGSAYAFNSKTTKQNSAAGGLNAGYTFKAGEFDGTLGGSLISSIGDAMSFQTTIGTDGEFAGFDSTSSTEDVEQIPGADLYTLIRLGGEYSLIGEYTTALRSFSEKELSYNGEGAQPSAMNAEFAKSIKLFNKPASVGVGYGWSGQSLALQLPQQSFRAVLNLSWWPQTLQSLEFEHSINYGANDYAAGIGSTKNTKGTSSDSDAVALLFAISF